MNSSNNLNKKTRHLLSISIALLMSQAAMAANSTTANEATPSAELDTIYLEASTETKKPVVETKEREQLEAEMVANNKDLVRYSIDVGLADGGRNQKGFSMRGVEANRVGISFDGIAIPDSEENSLYNRYSNYNSSRISIDPELARSVDFVKASDSFGSGSGSIGGSVNYRSVDVNDIVDAYEGFGGTLRSGYASKNDEWFTTIGIGHIGDKGDAMLLYSRREGHELKNHSGNDEDYKGTPGTFYKHNARVTPDPQNTKGENLLFKLNYDITPEHRVGLSVTNQTKNSFIHEKSYTLSDSYTRKATDENKLKTQNLYYEWTPDFDHLASIKLNYDHSKSHTASFTGDHYYIRFGNTNSGDIIGIEEIPDTLKQRYFKTELDKLSLNINSQPLESKWGAHELSSVISASKKDFSVLNDDIYPAISNEHNPTTIQYPTRTKKYSISLKDNIQWNDTLSSQVGVRYDHTKISLEDLNATCPICTANGATKPEGKKFNSWSGVLGINKNINDTWNLGYQISTGYRIPTGSEMYFTFINPAGDWHANPDLKTEKSINHTLSLNGENEIGSLDASVYRTDYKDFITEGVTVIQEPKIDLWTGQPAVDWWTGKPIMNDKPIYQMVNIDEAKVNGIEFSGSLNLDKVSPASEGWRLLGKMGYAEGKLSDGTSMIAIQPFKAVLGLNFDDPSDKWGISQRLSYLGSKKAEDAQYKDATFKYDFYSGTFKGQIEVKEKEYVNKPAFVYDISAYYRPTENLTLRGGIYNFFNQEYHTWDALRGINSFGSTNNNVDDDGIGVKRFTAPGRNFAVSAEYKF